MSVEWLGYLVDGEVGSKQVFNKLGNVDVSGRYKL